MKTILEEAHKTDLGELFSYQKEFNLLNMPSGMLEILFIRNPGSLNPPVSLRHIKLLNFA
jgi:hypothetical protein